MTGTEHTVGIVGLGLVGGSLARALLARDVAVVATTRSAATRSAAADAGVTVVDDVAQVVGEADVVVLAVPLPVLGDALAAVASALPEGPRRPTVTDVGSVKAPIAARAAELLDDPSAFVPGHPMAGTEHQGWDAADPTLFHARRWALVADVPVGLGRWAAVAGLATAVGAEVVPVQAEAHDAAVALVSHLPYALAAAAASMVEADPDAALARSLAAGSFRDLTRVAGGHPSLGAEMALANRRDLSARLTQLGAHLRDLADRLEGAGGRDAAGVEAFFAAGRVGRQALDRSSDGTAHPVRLDREGLLALGRRGGRVVAVAATPIEAEAIEVTVIDPDGGS